MNSVSLFANARVSLPVVLDIFVGGITPFSFNNSANFGLLIKSSLSTPTFSNNCFFFSFKLVECPFNKSTSNSSTGSINIFKVKSIRFISNLIPLSPSSIFTILCQALYVKLTSFTQ